MELLVGDVKDKVGTVVPWSSEAPELMTKFRLQS